MEQTRIVLRPRELEEPLTEIELEVADFMDHLRLATLQPEPDPAPPRRLPFSWGFKRRRSAIDRSPSPPQTRPCLSPPTAKKLKLDAASSPATTLAFPPSESEEKLLQRPLKLTLSSKPPKKTEELLDRYDSLTSQNQALSQELAKVRCYHEKLGEENTRLKQILRVAKEQLRLEPEPPATAIGFNHHQVPYIVHHQQPLILDQTAVRESRNGGLLPCSREELFDLNVPPAEAPPPPPLDAGFRFTEMAAQARLNRFNRKQKIHLKNNYNYGLAAGKFRAVR